MENYKTRITVRGLRRADVNRAKEPIIEGEVIALPHEIARSLLRCGAVEPTGDEITVELDWGGPVALIKSDDRDALQAALEAMGARVLALHESMLLDLAGVDGLDLLAAVQARLGDGRLNAERVSDILKPDQLLNAVSGCLRDGTIGHEDLRFLLGMGSGEGAGGESETPPADQSQTDQAKSDPPSDKPAARGKPKT